MGANREKKLRLQARESREEVDRLNRALDETSQLLAMSYQQMKLAGGKIAWYDACMNEYRRLLANGQITVHVNG